MKLKEAMDFADKIKPNAFDDAVKLRWINELEGKVQSLVYRMETEKIKLYSIPGDLITELAVPYPYDKLYWMWLCAMIDFANGEYDKYQNAMAMANDAYSEYAGWYIRNCHEDYTAPSGGGGGTSGGGGQDGKDGKDGLSAYEIAVVHGFPGDEAAWLESLKGERGPAGADGARGPAGTTPVKGVDYFTAADLADLPYASQEEIGNIGAVLDAISGEAV